jgi:hypothetical protein
MEPGTTLKKAAGAVGVPLKRQLYKLLRMLEHGQRERTVAIVVQQFFNTAFMSTNMNAVYRTLEAYGVPEADIALLQRMQSGSLTQLRTRLERRQHAQSGKE